MKKSRRRWLGLGISAVVLVLVSYLLSRNPGWRQFRRHELWSSLVHARPGWLLAALAVTSSTYVVRAYRWKFFLDPLKKASLWTLFVAQVFGFSSIYLIGRLGEIVRPAYIARRENVSYTSQAAVWLLERIYDTVSMVVLFALALRFEPIYAATPHTASLLRRAHGVGSAVLLLTGLLRNAGERLWEHPHEAAGAVLLLTGLLLIGLVIFRLYSDTVTARITRAFRFLPRRFQSYLDHFLRSFSEGLEVIQNWKDFLASVASTVVLWTLNASMFWLVFQSLGGGVEKLSWWQAAHALFFAALGLVVQLPGVGGGFQIGAILALRQVFHLGTEEATSAGILVWVVVLVPCVTLGAALLLYEGLTFKKLQAMAEEGRAAAVEKA